MNQKRKVVGIKVSELYAKDRLPGKGRSEECSDRNCLKHLGKHKKCEDERGKEGKRGPRSQIRMSRECEEGEHNSMSKLLEEMQ